MNLPINGRIAILEDNFNQAYPIMELFGKLQIPYVYYTGDLEGLPEEGKAANDIRILFLDIYLTGSELRSEKELKSALIPRLNRILSVNNYPYILIYWSRHEAEHAALIRSIFENELKDKAPINYLSLQKSDYFHLNDEKNEDYEEKKKVLLDRINEAISAFPAFKYLMNWENNIHLAADNVLEEVFKLNVDPQQWNLKSQNIFSRLAISYAGKDSNDLSLTEVIKSSLFALNYIFNDSLEDSISNKFKLDENEKPLEGFDDDNETIFLLNKKLLISGDVSEKFASGNLYSSFDDRHNFSQILNFAINREELYKKNNDQILERIKHILEEKVLGKERKKIQDEIYKKLKQEIKTDLLNVELNVTPVCDFVQNKTVYYRIIPGVLINAKHIQYFIRNSEALYISPIFKIPGSDTNYFLLLDFKFFTSIKKEIIEERLNPRFRIRQNMLSEIQSKLSRHINRQGVLFVN